MHSSKGSNKAFSKGYIHEGVYGFAVLAIMVDVIARFCKFHTGSYKAL